MPTLAEQDPGNAANVILTLATPLQSGQQYVLTTDQIRDQSQNSSDIQMIEFTYYEVEAAVPGDILINEIMADPTRSGGQTIGLPPQEFIELYNPE